MKITFEGRTWELDEDELTVKQAMVLHMTYGMTIREWNDGIQALDQRAFHFTYWLMLQQNGVVKPIGDCDPKLIAFMEAYVEAQHAEEAASVPEPQPAAVPTPPALPLQPPGSMMSATPTAATPQPPPLVPQEAPTGY